MGRDFYTISNESSLKLSLILLDSSTTRRALLMVTTLWARCFSPLDCSLDTQYVTEMLELHGGDRLVIIMSIL